MPANPIVDLILLAILAGVIGGGWVLLRRLLDNRDDNGGPVQ